MRKNSLVSHRNASIPRGYWCFFPRRGYDMVNQNFKAGDNTCIHACFFVCAFVGFCLLVQILISQMNTNIYSVNVWAPCHFGCFATIKFFVGAAGCNSKTLQCVDAETILSLSLFHSACLSLTSSLSRAHSHTQTRFDPLHLFLFVSKHLTLWQSCWIYY